MASYHFLLSRSKSPAAGTCMDALMWRRTGSPRATLCTCSLVARCKYIRVISTPASMLATATSPHVLRIHGVHLPIWWESLALKSSSIFAPRLVTSSDEYSFCHSQVDQILVMIQSGHLIINFNKDCSHACPMNLR